jgi:menaquinol-cytochrome c reductase iron-sulfur subunit
VADDPKTNRRGALRTLAVVSGAIGCGSLAVPAVRFVTAPVHAGAAAGRWIKTVKLDALAEGQPKRVAVVADHRDAWTMEKQVQLGGVWLVREGDAVKAWSVTCPHLGCAIDRSSSGPGFNCPCHDSEFAADGKRVNGPSPRDMDALDTKLEDGFVLVDFHRYRQGVPGKDPLG